MQELIDSADRFTAAVTIFGMQEFQNALDSIMESKPNRSKFHESLDHISEAIAGELNADHKPTLDSVTQMSDDWVDRTFKVLSKVDGRGALRTANDAMRKTADALSRESTPAETKHAKKSPAAS
jgi:hypothetical protein